MSGMLANIVFAGNIPYLQLDVRQKDPSDNPCWMFVRFRVFALPWITAFLKWTYRENNYLWCKALFLRDLQSPLALRENLVA